MIKKISFVFLLVILFATLILLCSFPRVKSHISERVLVSETFEKFPVGKLSFASLASDIGNTELACGKLDWLKFELGITPYPIFIKCDTGNKYLSVLLQLGNTMPVTGSQWDVLLDSSYRELTLSYRVKFDSSFVFKPGKLPGIRGGVQVAGVRPNGKDGLAARLMYWKGGRLSLYLYHPEQPRGFGDILFTNGNDSSTFCFSVNRWYEVALHVKLNDVGARNGLVYATIDGVEVLRKENLRFRDIPTLGLDKLSFSVFANEIAPSKDEHIYFDDLVLNTN
ncbi:MAG TPA: hypothetical protein VMW01_11095 [Williamwhitmania sp.]|nr:hypothetical protein [Williamwhitmania sp.]